MRVASDITIDREHMRLLIDGDEFPWAIAEDGPTLDRLAVPAGDVFVVYVPILAMRVRTQLPEEPKEQL